MTLTCAWAAKQFWNSNSNHANNLVRWLFVNVPATTTFERRCSASSLNLSEASLSFVSLNYPNEYHNLADCSWRIVASSSNHVSFECNCKFNRVWCWRDLQVCDERLRQASPCSYSLSEQNMVHVAATADVLQHLTQHSLCQTYGTEGTARWWFIRTSSSLIDDW